MRLRHNMLSAASSLFLTLFSLPAMSADNVRPQRYTLVIHMTPAVCAMDPSRRNLRQCQEGFSLTIA